VSSAPARAAADAQRVRLYEPVGRPGAGEAALAGLDDGARFAAYVAHELRAPLALQRALVEVALTDPQADAATLRRMGERVIASCTRQEELIDALLDLVRSGHGVGRRKVVDLAAIAAVAMRTQDLAGLGRAVALEQAWTTGDPDLLARLAGNLISNAVRYNQVDGWVEIATRVEPGRAVLSVANTGPAVPPGELERLFQPFQRLGTPRTEAATGAGLGLAVVRSIADAHGAIIDAQARPGGGLRIDVRFPSSERTGRER
jgi:signal transduction histidine kinase